MGAVGGGFAVEAQQVIAVEVMQVLHPGLRELPESPPQGLPALPVVLYAGREERRVGEAAVLDQQDRRLGEVYDGDPARFVRRLEKGPLPLGALAPVHVEDLGLPRALDQPGQQIVF